MKYLFSLLFCFSCLGQEAFSFRDPSFLATPLEEAVAYSNITFRLVNYTNTTTSQTTYTSSNGTFYAGELALVLVINTKASAPEVPTLSGNGMQWDAIYTTNYNPLSGSLGRMTIFRSMTNATTPTGIITAGTFSSATGGGLIICAYSNVSVLGTRGSDAIVQVIRNAVDATADPSLTLASLSTSGYDSVHAFFCNDVNGFGGTPETDWTEDRDQGYNTPATGSYSVHRNATTDNTVVVTRNASDWCGWAAEIKCIAASVTNYYIKQGFEGTGYDNSEVWTESGTGTIDEDYTGVAIEGSQTLRIALSAQTGDTYKPIEPLTAAYGFMRFRRVSHSSSPIIATFKNTGTTIGYLSLSTSALAVQASGGTLNASTDTVTAGTDIYVWFEYVVGTGANAIMRAGWSTDGTKPTIVASGAKTCVSNNGTSTAEVNRLYLGTSSSSTYEFIYDKVRVDDVEILSNPD